MQSSDLADQVVATNADCDIAERVVAAAPDRPHGSASYQAEGFTCTAGTYTQPTGGGKGWVPYTCRDRYGAVVSFNRY